MTLLSLIIPAYNCSEPIAETLESIRLQQRDDVEVIVVDGGSQDKTIEVVGSFHPLVTRLYTAAETNPYALINRGLALASGKYITFLFPGCVYLSKTALSQMQEEAMKSSPDLLYAGGIQFAGDRTPRQIFAPLNLLSLRKGESPALLPACLFAASLFETLGPFDSTLQLRVAYDYFCRIREAKAHVTTLDRTLVEWDVGSFSYATLLAYASDTWRILNAHFGLGRALIWFLGLNHFDLLKWWLRNLKTKVIRF